MSKILKITTHDDGTESWTVQDDDGLIWEYSGVEAVSSHMESSETMTVIPISFTYENLVTYEKLTSKG